MIPKLEVDGVSYSYHSLDGETLALDHISFDVSPGEFLAIVGPSGCGKSTLLSMLCGLTQPEGGIDGIPLTKSPSAIGYMLQKDHLFEWRNIFSNISLGLEIQKRLDEPARQELLEMMAAYGLAGFEYAKPSELSGGMRQRAALIRTWPLSRTFFSWTNHFQPWITRPGCLCATTSAPSSVRRTKPPYW